MFDKDVPSNMLIRKGKMCQFLRKNKLSIIWIVQGEKGTIGGGEMGQPFGWLEAYGIYSLNSKNQIVGGMKSKFNKSR